jgi:hypothetical protein
MALPPGMEAVAITKSHFWREPVSPTFHGRDILAPVAARLSLGFPPSDFGEPVTSVIVLPLSHPELATAGSLVGHVIHIDNFGNLITDIHRDDLPATGREIVIEAGNQIISGLSRTYAEREGLLALIGSSGYLEIALTNGSASARLGIAVGDAIRITTN